mgnify:FL=1
MGVVAIVQVLNQEMNKRANTVLVAYEKEQRKQKNKTQQERLSSRDVNKIFGWSIYHLRKQKIKKMANQDLPQPTRYMLKKELNFLESMIFHKEDALLDETYMAKSYDVFMRSSDRGGLTLVNP